MIRGCQQVSFNELSGITERGTTCGDIVFAFSIFWTE